MQERRRYVRIPQSSQISYRVLPNTGAKRFLTRDISEGGVRFFVHKFVPLGSLLEISITIGEVNFSLGTIAKSRWVSKEAFGERHEIGAEFIDLPKEARDRISGYISNALSEF
ncbi:PilZ domain-containing protein [Thermoproteota archaeon]